jgi:type I restriction enzyme S subunit
MGYAQYNELDNSGVVWLQKKPRHWRMKRLKFSTDLINHKVSVEESLLPYLGLEHIESWTGRKIDGEISNSEGFASSFAAGDVLFGKLRPYLAKVHLTRQDGLISSEALVVRGKDELHADFLKYYMLSRDFINIVDSSTYGSKMPRASWDFIGNLPVLLPEVQEQKAIARFLDFKTAQIDALIAKKKSLLDKLAEKRTALISHAVTKGLDPSVAMKESKVEWLGSIPQDWRETRVKFLGELILGLTYSPEDVVGDGGTLVLRSSNVQDGKISLNDCVYVSCDIPKKIVTKVDDILICSRNGSRALIGKCALLTEEVSHQAFGAFMTVLRSRHARFLYYVLNSTLFKFQSGRFLTSTINQLTTQTLGDFEIALPPVETQLAIVNYLDKSTVAIDAQCRKAQSVIDQLTEYRVALITNAVTGKIDVRDFQVP